MCAVGTFCAFEGCIYGSESRRFEAFVWPVCGNGGRCFGNALRVASINKGPFLLRRQMLVLVPNYLKMNIYLLRMEIYGDLVLDFVSFVLDFG